MFKKILIANRGEIALRVLRTCREMGIGTVCIHSTADSSAMHVRLADESVCVGPGPSKDSYLNARNILAAAELTGADAIHPGIGFLSENSDFAAMVEDHDLTFIGPRPDHIRIMGDKIQAKAMARSLGLPLIPGSKGAIVLDEEAIALGREIGYPILVKACSGGGGKGMQRVYKEEDLSEALNIARQEALANFGSDEVFIEKLLERPHHIEVQILGDSLGHVVALGDRDCSLQRRHQKIWEEGPAFISPYVRQEMIDISIKAMKKLGYQSAGTIEFLYEKGKFYFIEMNTRLQVEHTITEMITGIDLVKHQILVAAGEALPWTQKDIVIKGHAIQCRINAEHPETFAPQPGTVQAYTPPGGLHVRVDSALYQGYKIPPYYDSLIAKLVVYGDTRQECLARLDQALREYAIMGFATLIPLHRRLCQAPEVQEGTVTTDFLEKFLALDPVS